MHAEHSRHIALTGRPADWIDGQVAKRAYASISDVSRAPLRLPLAQGVGRGEAGPAAAGQPARRHGHV